MICSPFFGLNFGVHRAFLEPNEAPPPAYVSPTWFRVLIDHARFDLRRPLPDAATGLAALANVARVAILTGRRTSPAAWLRRKGLDRYIESITINHGRLRSPHFKLDALQRLRPRAHVDDDPRTVQLLAQSPEVADVEVYVRDWPLNRELPYHPRVERVATLHDVAARIAAIDARSRTR